MVSLINRAYLQEALLFGEIKSFVTPENAQICKFFYTNNFLNIMCYCIRKAQYMQTRAIFLYTSIKFRIFADRKYEKNFNKFIYVMCKKWIQKHVTYLEEPSHHRKIKQKKENACNSRLYSTKDWSRLMNTRSRSQGRTVINLVPTCFPTAIS